MFGGNVRPSHGRTKDSAHGGANSGPSVHDSTRGVGNGEPEPEAAGITAGDGMHHHAIHENPEGGYHSVHTHPDGREEHEDHATLKDAKEHLDRAMDHQDMGADDGAEEMDNKYEDDDDQPDFSGAYSK